MRAVKAGSRVFLGLINLILVYSLGEKAYGFQYHQQEKFLFNGSTTAWSIVYLGLALSLLIATILAAMPGRALRLIGRHLQIGAAVALTGVAIWTCGHLDNETGLGNLVELIVSVGSAVFAYIGIADHDTKL